MRVSFHPVDLVLALLFGFSLGCGGVSALLILRKDAHKQALAVAWEQSKAQAASLERGVAVIARVEQEYERRHQEASKIALAGCTSMFDLIHSTVLTDDERRDMDIVKRLRQLEAKKDGAGQ